MDGRETWWDWPLFAPAMKLTGYRGREKVISRQIGSCDTGLFRAESETTLPAAPLKGKWACRYPRSLRA